MSKIDYTKQLVKFKDGKKVMLDGPLSRLMTDTLNKLYIKEIDEETGISLESQVFQIAAADSAFTEFNNETELLKDNGVGILYAVQSTKAATKDLINIAKASGTMSDKQLAASAVIIDKQSDEETPTVTAIESFCQYKAIPVYASLEAYMKIERSKNAH